MEDVNMDMEALEQRLSYYEKQGAMLTDVPEDFVSNIVEKCKTRKLECKLSPQDDGMWSVWIKGKG